MTTIKEIAEKAGVGIGTVDRVLHNRGRVSEKTIERVRRVAEELGFKPNPFARQLSMAKEWRFGLVMPDTEQDSGYWRLPYEGASSEALSLQGYRVKLVEAFYDRYDRASFRQALRRVLGEVVDGLLLAPVLGEAASAEMSAFPLPPVVAFDTELEHPAVRCSIHQDSRRAGRLAGRLMRRSVETGGPILVLAPDADNYHILERLRGIRDELGDDAFIAAHPHEAELEGYARAIKASLPAHSALRGLIVADATTGMAARALRSLGIEGIRLIGFDLMEDDTPFLESGEIDFLITQEPKRQCAIGVRQLFNLLVLGDRCEREIRVPIGLVTKENYLEQLSM
jgi:LacI family transcriptional regulator